MIPANWKIERDNAGPFKRVIITAPNGFSAVAEAHSRNPENVLYMLADALLLDTDKEIYAGIAASYARGVASPCATPGVAALSDEDRSDLRVAAAVMCNPEFRNPAAQRIRVLLERLATDGATAVNLTEDECVAIRFYVDNPSAALLDLRKRIGATGVRVGCPRHGSIGRVQGCSDCFRLNPDPHPNASGLTGTDCRQRNEGGTCRCPWGQCAIAEGSRNGTHDPRDHWFDEWELTLPREAREAWPGVVKGGSDADA